VGECKAAGLTAVFSLRVNELILDLLGSLNNQIRGKMQNQCLQLFSKSLVK
jgi:hypothetical protein